MVFRTRTWLVTAVSIAALLMASGCAKEQTPQLVPKIEPPLVGTAGTLRAGIDLSTPPFGGKDRGREAGIDVDTAAALADRFGLKLEIVDVKPSEVGTALADGEVDVVFSVPFTDTSAAGITAAGTYITDAPAFFAAAESSQTGSAPETYTIDTVKADRIAVQENSPAYWTVRGELGDSTAVAYPTLREALQAVIDGKVQIAAGDALVGAYMMRDLPGLAFAGQLIPAQPIAVVVAEKNTGLADEVRTALDELAADGVLDTIRAKWVGDLPELTVEESVPAL